MVLGGVGDLRRPRRWRRPAHDRRSVRRRDGRSATSPFQAPQPASDRQLVTGDVLVVGAGPAGAAVATSLASQGHAVTVIDRALSGRGKPCGELLTPRAIAALRHCGVAAERLGTFHAVTHVRFTTAAGSSSTRWPTHDDYADHAVVVPRERLDQVMIERAEEAGRHSAARPRRDCSDRRPRLRSRRSCGSKRRVDGRPARHLHRDRRRCQQPLRPRPRHASPTDMAVGAGSTGDLRLVAARRRRGRVRARPHRSRRHPDHRVRLDVPPR